MKSRPYYAFTENCFREELEFAKVEAGLKTRHRLAKVMKLKQDECSAFLLLQLNKAKMSPEIGRYSINAFG